jgi:RNA polymerase sigma-70 factor (ECF subfamily)
LQAIFDEQWRKQALSGQPQAVQRLADESLVPLFRFCFHRVGSDHHLCEEVVQETLLRALRDLANYEPARASNNIFAWLTGLARNEIHRVLTREKAAVSLELLWERMDADMRSIYSRLDGEPFSDEVLQREETRALVNAAMAQLPPHYRQVLEAKYLEGESVRMLAVKAGHSEKAIESQLTRARQAFRETFLALTRNLELGVG